MSIFALLNPNFQFVFRCPHNSNSGYITMDEERNHIILVANVDEFYRALGYTDEIRQAGLMVEEFILNEYHKDNGNKDEICLQIKIIQYLKSHSTKFEVKFADQCEAAYLNCIGKSLNNFVECMNCAEPMLILKSPPI